MRKPLFWTLAIVATLTNACGADDEVVESSLSQDDTPSDHAQDKSSPVHDNGTNQQLGLGEPCTNDIDCQSGHCVDEVCCNSACGNGATDDCLGCSQAVGASQDGTCETLPANTTCRAAIDFCDIAEVCDGTSTSCPSDAIAGSGTVCRPSAGNCDVVETCDGTSPYCPTDVVVPAGTECRPSVGICDVPDFCDGLNGFCPFDGVQPSSTLCRPPAGPCDKTEYCDGTNPICPPDFLLPIGTVCRPALYQCDAVEICDGTGVACMDDRSLPDGEPCFLPFGQIGQCNGGACQPPNTNVTVIVINDADVNGTCAAAPSTDHEGFCSLATLFVLAGIVGIRRSWRR